MERLLLLIWALLASVAAVAADEIGPTRVLIVTGGHGFEREPFFAMFADMADVSYEEAHQEDTATAYTRSDVGDFDVIVLYDMMREISDEQQAAFLNAVDRGVGLVVLHHALVSYQGWDEYERIVGGRYPESDATRGQSTPAVGYRHDVDIPIQVEKRDHPVTAGIDDFVIHDEIYWGYRVSPEVTPLLTTSHPDSGNPIAWAHEFGSSRVVTIQPGHSPSAFTHPAYKRLVRQSIEWVARRNP